MSTRKFSTGELTYSRSEQRLHGSEELGMVIKKMSGIYSVRTNDRQVYPCTLSNRLRPSLNAVPEDRMMRKKALENKRIAEHSDPVTVGDQVRLETSSSTGSIDPVATIVEVFPRRSKLARRAPVPMPSAHAFEQVIVANLDQAAAVISVAQPTPKWNLLDRYLISAESSNLNALICITKIDLLRPGQERDDLYETIDVYRRIGYEVVLTSATSGEGIDKLRHALAGRFTALLGKSGVGKTSLLNALQPGLGLRVNAVSQATGKGRHTTTHLEMFEVDNTNGNNPALIIDTPGIREFGLWEIDGRDLALLFPEMVPYVGNCRFGLDCRHDEEPDCAVRKAVLAGAVSPNRYHSYLRLMEER